MPNARGRARRRLLTTVRSVPAVGYDAEPLQRLAAEALPPARTGQNTAHLWFTSRPLMAWDEAQGRYRLCLRRLGHPSIVSMAAIEQVLGLAARTPGSQGRRRKGPGGAVLCGPPKLDWGTRAAEVMTTYAMEAVLQALGGDPDCNAPRCRLSRTGPYRFTAPDASSNGGLCPAHVRQFQTLHFSPAGRAR